MNGPVQVLSVLFVALSNATYALIVGVWLAGRWLGATAADRAAFSAKVMPVRPLRRLGLASVAILVLGHLVHVWFVAASMSGRSGISEVMAVVPTILSSTRQGTLWYANSVILLALLAATLVRSQRARTSTTWLLPVSLCLLAAIKAVSGHAADAGDFTLAEVFQFLHLLATAVWAGAVVVSGLLVVPHLVRFAEPAGLWSYGKRLSGAVTWGLLVLLLSGIYTADRELNGSLHALWTSSWGKVLVAKVTFALIALLLGALSRFKCLKRPATGGRAALMATLLRTEAVVMILILCLSSLLANTPPAMGNT